MGVTVGDSGDAPPNVPAPQFEGGSIVSEGWRQCIDSHSELRTQGFQIVTEVDVRCSQKKVPTSAQRSGSAPRHRIAGWTRPKSRRIATTDRSRARRVSSVDGRGGRGQSWRRRGRVSGIVERREP